MIGDCGINSVNCISEAAVVAIFAVLMGLWALGFGLGKAVAWTRALRSAA